MPKLPLMNCWSRRQHGGALLVMLVILVMGITTAFIASLSGTAIGNQRNNTTANALAQAKEALIGYAVTYGDTHSGDTHGYLPCPDMDGTAGGSSPYEGSSETCGTAGASSLGRLPWRTLDLPALADGTSECLWYAVSGNYKNNPPVSGGTMNWDTAGQLQVYAEDGITEISPDEIVAVIIAPGSPLSGNSSRAASGAAPTCGGNYTASAYLDNDTAHTPAINNADIAQGKFIMPHDHRDANGNITLTVNDQFVFITRQDIWQAIEHRVAREARKCLEDYATTSGGKFPWPAPVSTGAYVGTVNTLFGRIADAPNRDAPYSSNDAWINDMMDYLTALQTALDNYAANNNATTRNALDNAGDNLNDTADDILDAGTYPANIEAVASPAKSAGSRAEHLADGDFGYTIAGVQTRINEANTALAALPSSPDADMQTSWPTGCFTAGTYWDHWKELVFYQIASGYKPGSATPACDVGGVNSCLSLHASGQAVTGSGGYRATVIVAGRKLGANRNLSTLGDYLEPDNQLPAGDNTQPYKTYRVTDGNYQTINDRVLCLDGAVNCN